MNHLKYSRGFSAWTLLPWLLFFTLAFVFWWFVNERTVGATGVVEPLTQAQVAPTAPSSMADSNDNLAIAPAVELAPVASYHEAVGRASLSVVNIYTPHKKSAILMPTTLPFVNFWNITAMPCQKITIAQT